MKKTKLSLFIMPRSSEAWRGSEAIWVTVGGWAAAAANKYGKAYVLTTDRISTPEEVLRFPLGGKKSLTSSTHKKFSSYLPTILTTFLKDILLWKSTGSKSNYNFKLPENAGELVFIWEHHDLFPGAGYKLSRKYKVPFIIYVHAPQVWEAEKWGLGDHFGENFLKKWKQNL